MRKRTLWCIGVVEEERVGSENVSSRGWCSVKRMVLEML